MSGRWNSHVSQVDTMKVTGILLLRILMAFGLLAVTLGNECNVTHVNHCYDHLVHYEGLGFPHYGQHEEELEETCNTMKDSFECIEVYVNLCEHSAECTEECEQMISDIETFSQNTGLRQVEKELCSTDGAMRQVYLENYSCLENNTNHYDICHNDSQMSQEYMTTLREPVKGVAARCCFFTWYHDCFTNITREKCNENATLFVSLTLYMLIGNITHQLCGSSPEICDRPPMNTTWKDDIDLEIDNSLDTNRGTSHALSTFCVTLCWIILLKCML